MNRFGNAVPRTVAPLNRLAARALTARSYTDVASHWGKLHSTPGPRPTSRPSTRTGRTSPPSGTASTRAGCSATATWIASSVRDLIATQNVRAVDPPRHPA
jgi:hypothetical protein